MVMKGRSVRSRSGRRGAFAAALYAFGIPLKEILEMAKGMAPVHVSKLKLSRLALFSNEELGRLIQSTRIGKARIEDSPIPLAIVTVDIATADAARGDANKNFPRVGLRNGQVGDLQLAILRKKKSFHVGCKMNDDKARLL